MEVSVCPTLLHLPAVPFIGNPVLGGHLAPLSASPLAMGTGVLLEQTDGERNYVLKNRLEQRWDGV